MKRIFAIIGAALFMLGFGIAYAGSALNNGVTDFTGKTYDSLEISAATGAGAIHEGSAAGGIRPEEKETAKSHNGVTDHSGKTYDTPDISPAPCVCNVAKHSAPASVMSDDRSWIDTDHN